MLRVDGKDRTLGATVANQVFVQKIRMTAVPDHECEDQT